MKVVEHKGAIRELIDLINTAFSEGPLPTVRSIQLTREEMTEVMKANTFIGGVGKYYGDADVPSLMNIKHDSQQQVIEFYLNGILVQAPPSPTPVP